MARGLPDRRAARLAAAALLARRPWTRAELAARLRRRGAPAEVASAVVDDLAARGDLDDAAFARQWVETRAARGYGAARLRAELRRRGVEESLIDAALTALAPAGALEAVRAVARRRLPALGRLPADRAARRLRDHLLRRGYPGPLVARVLRECLGILPED